MFFLQKLWIKSRIIFNLGAIVSILIFGNIASLAIYEIIKDKTVFMTNIHAIFLNPFFLITGGYLGIYIIYRLIIIYIKER
ncbi:transposase [Oceanobacillus arenosus]|uniref:Transposase n=1 Tax=Oceanobacillus arenosus TaxID=1229153 RepID=A0A3D8PYZ6_9BACI|nr:transposase [Oceanobacillus arenosus]